MKRALLVLVLVLHACAGVRAGGPGCATPNLDASPLDGPRAYQDAFVLLGNDPALCGDFGLTIHVHDTHPIPACRSVAPGCAIPNHWADAYTVHVSLAYDDPYAVLVHEFGHVLMWRVGWPSDSHHTRMGRMGFRP